MNYVLRRFHLDAESRLSNRVVAVVVVCDYMWTDEKM